MNQLRGVTLRPVRQSDLPLLLTLLGDIDRAHLWGQRRACDEQQLTQTWQQWSQEQMNDKFMVIYRGHPVGLVFDYERSLEDGHTKVATMLVKEACHRGAGVLATTLFAQWLFKNVPLRKFYLEVFEFNSPVVNMLDKLGLPREMQRAEHRYWNGRHWDQYGFAFYREALPDLMNRFARGRQSQQIQEHQDSRPAADELPLARQSSHHDSVDQALTSLLQEVS
ncbi:MAG: GNAT family protein [Planctomycetota bacterium]|nr:GNAT family protein [Planctomycetota bacterium]